MPAERVLRCDGAFAELRTSSWSRRGSNDYSNGGTEILGIVDHAGAGHEGVWAVTPTEIAPGIATRVDGPVRCIRIHAAACPVRVQLREWSEYVSYDNQEHCGRTDDDYWVRVVRNT